jgi:hypothetical protein
MKERKMQLYSFFSHESIKDGLIVMLEILITGTGIVSEVNPLN